MSRTLRTAHRRRVARGMAGFAALAVTLLAMLYLTTAHGAAGRAAGAPLVAAKKAPPEGGAPTRAVGERRFVTAEGKS